MKSRQTSLPKVIYFLDDIGILHCKYLQEDFDSELEIREAKQHVEAIVELCHGIPRPFLIDRVDKVGLLSMEAGKLLANDPKIVNLRLAEAHVVNSLATRLLVRFYSRMYSTVCPTELFTSMEEAIGFCKSYIDNGNR